jgi:hypothetical protein
MCNSDIVGRGRTTPATALLVPDRARTQHQRHGSGVARQGRPREAKGSGSERSPDETAQAVFELGVGAFRDGATTDGGEAGGRASSARSTDGGRDPEALDPTTESVLEELQGIDVEDTSPAYSRGCRSGSGG